MEEAAYKDVASGEAAPGLEPGCSPSSSSDLHMCCLSHAVPCLACVCWGAVHSHLACSCCQRAVRCGHLAAPTMLSARHYSCSLMLAGGKICMHGLLLQGHRSQDQCLSPWLHACGVEGGLTGQQGGCSGRRPVGRCAAPPGVADPAWAWRCACPWWTGTCAGATSGAASCSRAAALLQGPEAETMH